MTIVCVKLIEGTGARNIPVEARLLAQLLVYLFRCSNDHGSNDHEHPQNEISLDKTYSSDRCIAFPIGSEG